MKSAPKLSSVLWQDTLLDVLPIAVMTVERSGAIAWMNAAAENIFKASVAAWRGKPLKQVVPDAHVAAMFARVIKESVSLKEIGHGLKLNSGEVRVRLHLTPMDDHILFMCEAEAMAEQLTQQQIQREAARRAGLMAAMLAHEVKNPLAGIRGAAQLLGEGEGKEMAQLICREVDRVNALMSDIEIFSDTCPLALERVNIHEVLRDVRRMAEESFAAHVTFSEQFDPSLPEAAGTRGALIQVLLNIVKNAAEATEGQSDARITLRSYYRPGKQTIVLEVEDNGPGVPAEMREVLFAPFQTTKQQGKGLGLAIVAKLVADMGGTVEMISEPGATRVAVALTVG